MSTDPQTICSGPPFRSVRLTQRLGGAPVTISNQSTRRCRFRGRGGWCGPRPESRAAGPWSVPGTRSRSWARPPRSWESLGERAVSAEAARTYHKHRSRRALATRRKEGPDHRGPGKKSRKSGRTGRLLSFAISWLRIVFECSGMRCADDHIPGSAPYRSPGGGARQARHCSRDTGALRHVGSERLGSSCVR